VAELGGLLDRDPHRVDTAHLAGADPDRLQVLRQHDRVRRDVLADAPGENEIAPLRLGQLAGHELPGVAFLDLGVGVLDEHATKHALVAPLAGIAGAPLPVEEDPHVLLLP
jgi:hypothetical protein